VYKKIIILVVVFICSFSLMYGQGEPVVYLEFSDFSGFLRDLQKNTSYREFMGSSVLQWYENSRLGLKFPKRIKEFEDVLGFALSLDNINSLAGTETGIWLFDIGELEMLMVTHIPESDYLRSRIARSRDRFGEGKIDTIPFYFKKDEAGNREVDFAFLDNHLIISNEPTAFEQCVRRLAAGGEYLEWKGSDFLSWAEESIPGTYDVLLYLSSESIRNTYFTSYWFHGNQEEIRSWFDSGVILVTKGDKEITERRIFKLVDGFAFDSLAIRNIPQLFTVIPEKTDMVKIRPVLGSELEAGLGNFLGGGKAMDSLIHSVAKMLPLAYGHFAAVRKGNILPEISEGFAVLVAEPDKGILKQFNDIYPQNLRTHTLFSKNMPDFAMDGNMLFFASEAGFFEKKRAIEAEGLMSYSFLDLKRFADAFSEEIELLSESERWRSYENRDFFKDNIGDLIRISGSRTASIEMKGKVRAGIFEQTAIYALSR
jgi:hypothetical protein